VKRTQHLTEHRAMYENRFMQSPIPASFNIIGWFDL